jgi:salicylate hydroxylase
VDLSITQTHRSTMDSQHQAFSIAIIGSGIGGLALAIGLLKQNVQCTIYEAAPKFDAVGAGIGLGPNALRSMQMMDEKFAAMYDKVKVGNTSPERVHEQFEILGAEEGLGEKDGWHGGSVSHPDFTRSSAHRKALLDIMKSLIPDGIVQFNKRVFAIDQEGGKKVVIRFEDGQNSEVDAVIGCDGIKGMTRRVVLESRYPEEIPAKYANTYVYRGIAPMEEAREILGSYAEDAKWYMMEKKGWAMYPISKGTEINMVAFMHDEKPWTGEQVATQVTREEMEEEFEGFDERLKGVLKVTCVLFY